MKDPTVASREIRRPRNTGKHGVQARQEGRILSLTLRCIQGLGGFRDGAHAEEGVCIVRP